jgi:hypothetical protein
MFVALICINGLRGLAFERTAMTTSVVILTLFALAMSFRAVNPTV